MFRVSLDGTKINLPGFLPHKIHRISRFQLPNTIPAPPVLRFQARHLVNFIDVVKNSEKNDECSEHAFHNHLHAEYNGF